MPYLLIQNKDLPADVRAGGAPEFEHESGVIRRKTGHFGLESMRDDKNVRINSRSYTRVESECSGLQVKPSATATGTSTVSMCGLEASPRFQAGVAGANLIAIKADPLLKKGTGNLSGGVCGVQVSIDFGISGTRVISGNVAAFEAFLAIPSTYTYSAKVSFLRVRNVNIKSWDFFLDVEGGGTGLAVEGATLYKDPNSDDEAGYLKIQVNSTYYQMPFWATS